MGFCGLNSYCKLNNGNVVVIWSDNIEDCNMNTYPLKLESTFDIIWNFTDLYEYKDIKLLRCNRDGSELKD